MKNSAVFINIGRGATVDMDALADALQNKVIAGAAMDAMTPEPLNEDSPLWDMENVILTPHNSFIGNGNGDRICELILANLRE
jgi:phosphoglycerate dehydrogenase-like enzyme